MIQVAKHAPTLMHLSCALAWPVGAICVWLRTRASQSCQPCGLFLGVVCVMSALQVKQFSTFSEHYAGDSVGECGSWHRQPRCEMLHMVLKVIRRPEIAVASSLSQMYHKKMQRMPQSALEVRVSAVLSGGQLWKRWRPGSIPACMEISLRHQKGLCSSKLWACVACTSSLSSNCWPLGNSNASIVMTMED